MAVLGDRAVAGLLSALAEAPDFQSAASFLVAQLVDISGASRVAMLRLEPSQESLALVTTSGFAPESGAISVSASDLSNPLTISTLALVPIRGRGEIGPRALSTLTDWYALPVSQPRYRGAPE